MTRRRALLDNLEKVLASVRTERAARAKLMQGLDKLTQEDAPDLVGLWIQLIKIGKKGLAGQKELQAGLGAAAGHAAESAIATEDMEHHLGHFGQFAKTEELYIDSLLASSADFWVHGISLIEQDKLNEAFEMLSDANLLEKIETALEAAKAEKDD